MTTEVRFYHLQRSTLDQALPAILKKAYAIDHRIVVRVGDEARAKLLDKHLWVFESEGFLPHGICTEDFDDQQPILITHQNDNPNEANLLVLTDGASAEGIANYALCCDVFDGADQEQLQAARARWRVLKDAGEVTLSYFQQNDNGGWEKKA